MKDLFKIYSIGDFVNQSSKIIEFDINRFEEMDEPDVAEVHNGKS